MLRLIPLTIVICFSLSLPGSAEKDFKARLPRIAATEPDKALETFTVKDGFEMQLLASEPNVADPVALDFDARGRLYVAEMRGYSEQPGDLLGRIRLLEDTTGDGRFDKSTIYAAGLSWPTAVLCYDGGVFIAAGAQLLFLKDTNGKAASSVTLMRADGVSDTIRRAGIDQFRDTGMSLMPEGLEKQLPRQEMADLIAYLMSIR